MTNDQRIRYRVLRPITLGQHHRWLRVGTAYRNADGTIDVYLELAVLGTHLRLLAFSPDGTGADGGDDAESSGADRAPGEITLHRQGGSPCRAE